MSWSGNERHCAFLNTTDGRFADVSAVSGFDFLDDGRALASVDWDFDGDLDFWLVNRTGPQVRFLHNRNSNGNRFLALRLTGNGRTVNRDAIGARVEVSLASTPPVKLIRTLRAGEGYLSQSSKWLHFGLGQAGSVKRVLVRWPGATAEEFTGVSAGGHYHLTQGRGRAEPITPVKLTLADLALPETTSPLSSQSRTFLRTRVPLPPITYQGLQGQRVPLVHQLGQPLLLNLWATWCKPCAEELVEFQKQEHQLREAGLEIVALCVDGLGEQASDHSSGQPVQAFLSGVNFPFTAGIATPEAVEALDHLNQALFVRHPQLPVPASFLLDDEGKLAVVYRGRVSVQTLLEDIVLLKSQSPETRYRNALPFPGRSYGKPPAWDESSIAFRLTEVENWSEAAFYLELASQRVSQKHPKAHAYANAWYNVARGQAKEGNVDAALRAYGEALRVNPGFRDAHYNLAVLLESDRQRELAKEHYLKALKIDPQYYKAHINLGVMYAAEKVYPQAIDHYRAALVLVPDHLDTLNNLGNALVGTQELDEAIALFRRARELDSGDARTAYNLGVVLDAKGDYAAAVEAYTAATQLDSSHVVAHNNLGVALARTGKLDQAEKKLREALALDPAYESAKNNLALVLKLRAQRGN